MSAPREGSAPRGLAGWALLACMAAALLLVSCAGIDAELDLEDKLVDRGFTKVRAEGHEDEGDGHLEISATVAAEGEQAVSRRMAEASRLAWTTFPYRFDRMRVVLHHGGSTSRQVLPATDLQAQYGPRPAHLDDRSVSDEQRRIGLWGAVMIAAALLVVVGVAVLVVVLVRRSRRRRPPGWDSGPWRPPPVRPPEPYAGPLSSPSPPPPGTQSGWGRPLPPGARS